MNNLNRGSSIAQILSCTLFLGCDSMPDGRQGVQSSDASIDGVVNTQEIREDEPEVKKGSVGSSGLPSKSKVNKKKSDGPVQPDQVSDGNCGEKTFTAHSLPPNVMLVLDKSGSMHFETWFDGGVQKRRWESLHSVTTRLLKRLDGSINFGLKLFPALGALESKDKSIACRVDEGVEVECGPNQAEKVLAKMPGSYSEVYGDTPTVTGLNSAYKYLSTLDDPNQEAIVLVVDGQTNCGESNTALEELAAKSFGDKIPVYVVGIDLTSEVRASLSQVAARGGTKSVYNTGDSDALVSSLESILGGVVSCNIPLDSNPEHPDEVEVRTRAGKLLTRLSDFSSCEAAAQAGERSGWVFRDTNPSYRQIELCGSSCKNYRKDHNITVEYKCPPPI